MIKLVIAMCFFSVPVVGVPNKTLVKLSSKKFVRIVKKNAAKQAVIVSVPRDAAPKLSTSHFIVPTIIVTPTHEERIAKRDLLIKAPLWSDLQDKQRDLSNAVSHLLVHWKNMHDIEVKPVQSFYDQDNKPIFEGFKKRLIRDEIDRFRVFKAKNMSNNMRSVCEQFQRSLNNQMGQCYRILTVSLDDWSEAEKEAIMTNGSLFCDSGFLVNLAKVLFFQGRLVMLDQNTPCLRHCYQQFLQAAQNYLDALCDFDFANQKTICCLKDIFGLTRSILHNFWYNYEDYNDKLYGLCSDLSELRIQSYACSPKSLGVIIQNLDDYIEGLFNHTHKELAQSDDNSTYPEDLYKNSFLLKQAHDFSSKAIHHYARRLPSDELKEISFETGDMRQFDDDILNEDPYAENDKAALIFVHELLLILDHHMKVNNATAAKRPKSIKRRLSRWASTRF
jgi:hypothetical protein